MESWSHSSALVSSRNSRVGCLPQGLDFVDPVLEKIGQLVPVIQGEFIQLLEQGTLLLLATLQPFQRTFHTTLGSLAIRRHSP